MTTFNIIQLVFLFIQISAVILLGYGIMLPYSHLVAMAPIALFMGIYEASK